MHNMQLLTGIMSQATGRSEPVSYPDEISV